MNTIPHFHTEFPYMIDELLGKDPQGLQDLRKDLLDQDQDLNVAKSAFL